MVELRSMNSDNTVVVATHNAGKLLEISAILSSIGVQSVGAEAFDLPEPIETGDTFEANALLKAQSALTYVPATHLVLSDDSGLCVDGLDGAPGIYSARWAGANKDFALASQRIYDELKAKNIAPQGASARFVCVLALAKHGSAPLTFRGESLGKLTFPARGDQGFGYDPIFIPEGQVQTFAQMNESNKRALSHRTRAFDSLVTYLQGNTL